MQNTFKNIYTTQSGLHVTSEQNMPVLCILGEKRSNYNTGRVLNQGSRKQFFVGVGVGRGPKELDCADLTPTYPKIGHVLRHRHSLGILVHPFCVIHNYYKLFLFTVSSVHYAAARKEIFNVNSLRGKLQQIGSPNLQDIFIGR